jgi:hypothetical protein
MRWPKQDELRRWTPDDQVVFRNWRRGLVLIYGAISAYWLLFPRLLSAMAGLHGPM